MGWSCKGKIALSGAASGELLVSGQPLSFWGGYDPTSGEIIDRRHPLSGRMAAGSILALPATRGSSTTTAVLLESIRVGVAPSAFVTTSEDTFLALASIVGWELYGRTIPMVVISEADLAELERLFQTPSGRLVSARLDESGGVEIG